MTARERSNQPVTMDVVLFNRSASSAAEVRARQLADAERKSRSLPGGMHFKDYSLGKFTAMIILHFQR